MALGNNNRQSRIYLSISKGKIIEGTGSAKKYFSFIEGSIEAIYTRKSNFHGEEVTRWYIDIADGSELYSLCLPYNSGIFKSIVMSLASDELLSGFTRVKISPYLGNNGYTKVSVYSNGDKLSWVTKEIPPQEVIAVGEKQIKDDSKQMEFIVSLCSIIEKRLQNNYQINSINK